MDLSQLHPELLSSWNSDKNLNFDIHNVKAIDKVWWRCEKWHEWKSTIDNRTSWKWCPYCSWRLTIEWENDLATTHPELAKQWNYEKNWDLLPNKVKSWRVWWKCEKWHEWEAHISNREKWQWCPYCSWRLTIEWENDLATTHPEFLSERNYEKNWDLLPNKIKSWAWIKVWWKCEKWHERQAIVSSRVKNWNKCPYCSNQIVLKWYNDLATTDPELIKWWNYEKNWNITPDMVNRGSNKKYWRKCEKWHEWEATIASRSKRWNWCPYCSNQKLLKWYNDLATTHPELAKQWNYEKNWNITPDMVNAGSNKKYWWRCEKWHEWEAVLVSRANGCWCSICSGNSKKTDEEFKEEMMRINPDIIILDKYETAKTRLKCKCKICWNEREVVANHLQQWQWCPNCANIKRWEEQRIWQENFITRMKEMNPNILVLWKYKTAHDRVKVMCLNCGHRRSPLAWDILRWTWCPNCCHTSTSYIEKFIFYAFAAIIGKNNLISRDKKIIGKELDIYVPKYNFAIEPWSRFWHKDKLNEDLHKRKMCEKKWIKLVIIYDSCKDESVHEKLRKNDIIFFKEDLWNIKSKETLKWLVLKLFEMIDLPCLINEKQWDEISNEAYLASRQRNTEEFISDLKSKNGKVTVIWEYLWFKKKIHVKCNKCWYEWFAQAWHLLNWKACPKCAWVMLKTNEEFIEQLRKKNPNVKVLWKYVNSNTKIEIQCLICWNIRKSTPWNLLYWFWCPSCGRKKVIQANSKKVLQYSLDWKFIWEYDSIGDANRKTWINSTTICNVCNWKWKMAWWYIRKYKK